LEEDNFSRTRRNKSIRKVKEWQEKECDNNQIMIADVVSKPRPVFRGRTPSYEALRCAVTELFRIDDFDSERLGEGFYSEVFKVRHKITGNVMVLKKNKYRSNSLNSLKEIQLMNKLKHENILKFEAVCVHEGQLHALTEFIEGGTLEELIKDSDTAISWSDRIKIGCDISQGLDYLHSKGMFHRDLTSKNIFMKNSVGKFSAIIGDFGLATKIPNKSDPKLIQVGSYWWMSPECINGKYYDEQSDIFSFGIIMCELIARVEADPDILPRTNSFGVEYKLFSDMCPECPAEYLKLTFTCVSIDPDLRPRSGTLVDSLRSLLDNQRDIETQLCRQISAKKKSALQAFNQAISDSNFCDKSNKKTPSEKARLHSKSSINNNINARTVGEEMCRIDPHYEPVRTPHNPFTTLPRIKECRKIIGSNSEILFSSCVEQLPPQDNNFEWLRRKSLPHHCKQYSFSKNLPTKEENNNDIIEASIQQPKPIQEEVENSFKIIPLKQRVRKLFSQAKDDSSIQSGHGIPLRRWGSCESGFCSASTDDWITENGLMSNKSIGSSLLTVSDLEEDLRAASALLAGKRTSSIFTDSLDDISARLDDISSIGVSSDVTDNGDRYEKDIREIVEYFERNCRMNNPNSQAEETCRSTNETVRSKKIESLIKKVAENKSKSRASKIPQHQQMQHLQICDGIVQSKLPLFDNRSTREKINVRKKGIVNNGIKTVEIIPNNRN